MPYRRCWDQAHGLQDAQAGKGVGQTNQAPGPRAAEIPLAQPIQLVEELEMRIQVWALLPQRAEVFLARSHYRKTDSGRGVDQCQGSVLPPGQE